MSYFKGICGIHGYFVVSTYADSHCCLRVPLANALAVRDFLHVGDGVLTFRRSRATASRLG